MRFDEFQPEGSPITIVIGRNGSGKSSLLRMICQRAARNQRPVVAIAPSIFDRFRGITDREFKFFGGRLGRKAAVPLINGILQRAESDPQVLKNFTRALEYTGFDREIGLRIRGINLDVLTLRDAHGLSNTTRNRLLSLLEQWRAIPDQTIRLGVDPHSFAEMYLLSFVTVLRFAPLLRRIGAISPVEFFLFRNGTAVPLLEACSGELWFIISMGFVAVNITRGCLVVIDEPETSLHPTWQKDCVKVLLDLYHLYEPNIVLATHSPIVVSGAEAAAGSASVYESLQDELRPFEYERLGLEEMYDRLFGILTPKNHYLSNIAVGLLNDLNSGKQEYVQVDAKLQELANRSYDESQIGALGAIRQLAQRLTKLEESNDAEV